MGTSSCFFFFFFFLFLFFLHLSHKGNNICYLLFACQGDEPPVEFFYLHAGIADHFHHGGQPFQKFGLQPTKWIKISVSL